MTYVVQNEWKFDKDRLKSELHKILEKHYIQDKIVGSLHGISLMSQDGSIYNGFNFNVGLQDPSYPEQDKTDHNPTVYFKLSYAREHKIYHMLDYNIETSACTGYFKEIIDFLREKNMNPTRARLSYMEPNGEIRKHTDGNFYRFHIPIITTKGTDFVHGDESYILEEGNSYLAYVHPYHNVLNRSGVGRWHFVADVWDTEGNFSIGKISKEDFEIEKENAKLWRDYVNGYTNYPEKILFGAKNK